MTAKLHIMAHQIDNTAKRNPMSICDLVKDPVLIDQLGQFSILTADDLWVLVVAGQVYSSTLAKTLLEDLAQHLAWRQSWPFGTPMFCVEASVSFEGPRQQLDDSSESKCIDSSKVNATVQIALPTGTVVSNAHLDRVDLAKCVRGNESVEEIVYSIRQAAWQTDSMTRPSGIGEADLFQVEPANILDSLWDFASKYEKNVVLQGKSIVERRRGMRSGIIETLESIGQDFGVTRERVRQVESGTLRRMRGEKGRLPLNVKRISRRISELIWSLLAELEGVATGAEITMGISRYVDLSPYHAGMTASFLLALAGVDHDQPKHSDQPWLVFASAEIRESAESAREMLRLVAWEKPGVSPAEAVAEVTNRLDLPEKFIHRILLIEQSLTIGTDEGVYIVRPKAGIRRSDRLVVALREIGRPVHVSAILKKLKELFPGENAMTPHHIGAALLDDVPNVFRRVGTGTYGLSEWGLPFATDSVDLARQVLEGELRWLTSQELANLMRGRGWLYKAVSIKAALDLEDGKQKRRVRRFKDGDVFRYGLASWSYA